jgi:hypothetical protein
LTRTGNSQTPENTASLPSSGAAFSPALSGDAVTSSWKRVKSRSTSARLLPLTLSVIIEADAVEIEQPEPLNATSVTLSPSTRTYTVARSPQSGLWPSARPLASGSSRKFRGRFE